MAASIRSHRETEGEVLINRDNHSSTFHAERTSHTYDTSTSRVRLPNAMSNQEPCHLVKLPREAR